MGIFTKGFKGLNSWSETKVEFGEHHVIGKNQKFYEDAPIPQGSAPFQLPSNTPVHINAYHNFVIRVLKDFAESLDNVKKEEKGTYKRWTVSFLIDLSSLLTLLSVGICPMFSRM